LLSATEHTHCDTIYKNCHGHSKKQSVAVRNNNSYQAK
jgi:hypothetical protein